jgi:uncharacterized protein
VGVVGERPSADAAPNHDDDIRRRRWLEIAAVLLTCIGKFIFMDWLDLRLIYVSVAVITWVVYIVWRSRQEPGILTRWGFRRNNVGRVVRLVWPFVALALASFIIIGSVRGTINLSWHILPILITYPIWGTIQQFLLVGLVAGNLQDMQHAAWPTRVIIPMCAVLFSVVHYPNGWLMAGTFVLALYYGFIYLRERNVYVLGALHGWLGALFYYMVVGRDPFQEIFGKYL